MTLKSDGFSFMACGITSRSASRPAPDHFDLRQRCGCVKDPERGVFEIAAGDEPLLALSSVAGHVLRRGRVPLAHRGRRSSRAGRRDLRSSDRGNRAAALSQGTSA